MVPLQLMPTIGLGCSDCYVDLDVTTHVGLTVSKCTMRFTHTGPQVLQLRAVPTAGNNSRIVALKFRTVISDNSSVWQGFSMPDIRVTGPRFSMLLFCFGDSGHKNGVAIWVLSLYDTLVYRGTLIWGLPVQSCGQS